jgi:hypothetical protein
VFENRILRRIFGTKRDEVTGASYFVLNPLYQYASQIKENELEGPVSRIGEERQVYKVWSESPK